MSVSLGFTSSGGSSPGMGLNRNQHLFSKTCPRPRVRKFGVPRLPQGYLGPFSVFIYEMPHIPGLSTAIFPAPPDLPMLLLYPKKELVQENQAPLVLATDGGWGSSL